MRVSLERRRSYAAKWLAKNAARFREMKRNWRKRNNAKCRMYKHVRRAGGCITPLEWLEICREGKCFYCERPCAELTMDHVLAVSKGGANTADNIVAACRTCNSSKGNRDVLEWYAERFAA